MKMRSRVTRITAGLDVFRRRWLDAEEIRDAMLSASGQLDRTAGGPAADGIETPRRSLYVQTAALGPEQFRRALRRRQP